MRNFIARGHLKEQKKGDLVFIYHTGKEKQIVGVGEVIKEHYKDPTDEKKIFYATDVIAKHPLKTPVTLAAIKADARFKTMPLVKYATAVGATGDRHRVVADLQDGRREGLVGSSADENQLTRSLRHFADKNAMTNR